MGGKGDREGKKGGRVREGRKGGEGTPVYIFKFSLEQPMHWLLVNAFQHHSSYILCSPQDWHQYCQEVSGLIDNSPGYKGLTRTVCWRVVLLKNKRKRSRRQCYGCLTLAEPQNITNTINSSTVLCAIEWVTTLTENSTYAYNFYDIPVCTINCTNECYENI